MADEDEIKTIVELIRSGNVEEMLIRIREDPSLTHRLVGGFTCLEKAASLATFHALRGEEMIRALADAGCDPNQKNQVMKTTPLVRAMNDDNLRAVLCLLEVGADPNIGRMMFSAIRNQDPFPYIKTLVRHGVDLNQTFEMAGTGVMMNALDFAKLQGREDVVAYLRELQVEESSGSGDVPAVPSTPYLDRAAERFGDVSAFHLRDVVPTGVDVQIHVATAKNKKGYLTLFTSGLRDNSFCRVGEQQKTVPIELFFQLPRPWPVGEQALNDPKFNWPYVWTKKIALQLALERMTIEGPFAVWSAGEKGERIAAHLPHTAFLLMAEIEVDLNLDGTVYLMRLIPLYKEEVALESVRGMEFLIRHFDKRRIPFVFTEDRLNVAMNPGLVSFWRRVLGR